MLTANHDPTLMTDDRMPDVPDAWSETEARGVVPDAMSECAHLVREKSWSDVIALVGAFDGLVDEVDGANAQLAVLRIERVKALLQIGRGHVARAALEEAERHHGRTWETRQLLARLLTYLGDDDGALAACSEAMMSLPLDAKPGKTYRALALQRADILLALGRKQDAYTYLRAILHIGVPTSNELSLLRRSIDSPSALEAFGAYLAPMLIYPGQRARAALHQYSMACRDNGQPGIAIAAARQRFLSGLHIVTFGSRPAPDKTNWTRDAATALLDLKTDLKNIALDPFLVSGTLLGCVRDAGIIGHDKDIDVGVMTERSVDEIRVALRSSGHFDVKPLKTELLVQVQHANGVMLDVFLHWREQGLIYHEGQKARWWNKEFGLQPTHFLGEEFMIPTNPEQYLVENYGPGWRKPEPDFETFVDTPNMIAYDDDHMAWYYLNRLHEYYHAGKLPLFEKVWKALEPRMGGDVTLRNAVRQVIVDGRRIAELTAAQDALDAEAVR